MKKLLITKTSDALGMFNDQPILDLVAGLPDGNYEIIVQKQVRTCTQNRAMHKYFELVAEALNAGGYTKIAVLAFLKKTMPWSKESVKDDIWRNIMIAVGLGDKTSKLKSNEITKVYEYANQFITERLKMESIPFPKKEE